MKTETPTERLLAKLASARPEREEQPDSAAHEALPEDPGAHVTINEANLVALFHGVIDDAEEVGAAPVAASVVPAVAVVTETQVAEPEAKVQVATEEVFSQLEAEAVRERPAPKQEAKASEARVPEPVAQAAPVEESVSDDEVESMPEVQRAPSQAQRSYSTPKPPAKPARTERVIAKAPIKPPVKLAPAKSAEKAPVAAADPAPAPVAQTARPAATSTTSSFTSAPATTAPASGGQQKWLVIGGAVLLIGGAAAFFFTRGSQSSSSNAGQAVVATATQNTAPAQPADTVVPPPPSQSGTPAAATTAPVVNGTPAPANTAKSEPPKAVTPPPQTPAPSTAAPVPSAAPAPTKAAPKGFVPPTVASNRPATASTLPDGAAPSVNLNPVGNLAVVNTTVGNIPAPPRAAPTPAAPTAPVQAKAAVERPPVLVNKVTPVYPQVAQKNHIEGSVVFAVKVGKDGKVASLQPVSGNQMLYQAAREAIKQWTYTPSTVNGEAREATVNVSLNFTLGH